jgi:hypothetical protein
MNTQKIILIFEQIALGPLGNVANVEELKIKNITEKKENNMSEKESRWDIPKPNFKKDLEFGKQGEDQVKSFLQGIVNGSFEVKSDRYRNGRMVVEVAQNPRKHGWKDSGITITEAEWWVYVYTMNEAMIVISTDRLRRYIKTLPKSRLRLFAEGSNNPARGYLLQPEEVMALLYDSAFDGNVEE